MKRALMLIAVSCAVYALVAWWAASQLPAGDIAMHVNTAGEVDKSTSRAGAITYFVGLGGFVMLLAIGVVCMCAFVPIRFLNIPNKDYWTAPERVPTVRKMLVWDAGVIFSMPFLALSFIPVNIVLLSENPDTSALWIVAPIGLWLLAILCYTIWMVRRRYRRTS